MSPSELVRVAGPAPPEFAEPAETILGARADFLATLIGGDRRRARQIVDDLILQGATVVDIYVDLLQDAMYRVGELWERHQISVADEHLATIVAQQVLTELYSTLPPSPLERGPVLITGVNGEFHQMGPHMVANVLDAHGWDVCFLGTHLPERDVLRAVDAHAPRVVGISATMLSSVPRVESLIRAVRAERGGDIRFLVGGCAFRMNPGLATEIGADAFAQDAREALSWMLASASSSKPTAHPSPSDKS